MKLADFYHIFHLQDDEPYKRYQGEVAGTSVLRYTQNFPGDSEVGTLVADFDLDIPDCVAESIRYQNGHVAGRWAWLDRRLGYRGGTLALHRLSLHKGRGTISASGTMGLAGVLDMVAVADRVPLREFEVVKNRLPELEGSAAFTGYIKGTLEAPRADFELSASGLGWRGKYLGDGRFYLRVTDQSDPYVQKAVKWDRNALPANEPCARARRVCAGDLDAGGYRGQRRQTRRGRRPAHGVPRMRPSAGRPCAGRYRRGPLRSARNRRRGRFR
jgi:hypothetical protein